MVPTTPNHIIQTDASLRIHPLTLRLILDSPSMGSYSAIKRDCVGRVTERTVVKAAASARARATTMYFIMMNVVGYQVRGMVRSTVEQPVLCQSSGTFHHRGEMCVGCHRASPSKKFQLNPIPTGITIDDSSTRTAQPQAMYVWLVNR